MRAREAKQTLAEIRPGGRIALQPPSTRVHFSFLIFFRFYVAFTLSTSWRARS